MITGRPASLRVLVLSMSVTLLFGLPLIGQNPQPTVHAATAFDVSPPLRDLAKLPVQKEYGFNQADDLRAMPLRPALGLEVDPVEQKTVAGPSNYSVGLNLPGSTDAENQAIIGRALVPPDPNLSVGDTQVVQWINLIYAVYDKMTGALVAGPFAGNALWAGFGGECETFNEGDIIAQWDKAAHRWILAQNVLYSGLGAACIAISTSPDATGTYYRYQFPLAGYPDYPKYGIWTNSYVETNTDISGPYHANPCIYDRAKLLVGNSSAEQVCFVLSTSDLSLLPADIDSNIPPPANQDVFLIGGLGAVDTSHLSLYSIHVDWSNPQDATITGNHNSQLIAIPTFTPACNGRYQAYCIPEEGGEGLASLGDRLMYRFAYWEDPPLASVGSSAPRPLPSQHWLVSHAVTASAGQNAMRWYEFTAPIRAITVSGLSLFQSGTYAPDSNHRWMGSLARDKSGDILMGYSVSSADVYPSIAVAGRVVTDPLGTLEPEVLILSGTGSQINSYGRWGDYTNMAIDGSDGCTFWYTNEFYATTSSYNFLTQLASIRFPGCR
jgi:hypothetical protein